MLLIKTTWWRRRFKIQELYWSHKCTRNAVKCKKRNEIQNEELFARSAKPAHAFLNACRPVHKMLSDSANGGFPRTNRTLTVTHLNMRRRSRRTSPEPEVRPGEGPHERVLPKPRDVEKERDHRTGEGPQDRRGTTGEERDLMRGTT